jgi:hypothetical protein
MGSPGTVGFEEKLLELSSSGCGVNLMWLAECKKNNLIILLQKAQFFAEWKCKKMLKNEANFGYSNARRPTHTFGNYDGFGEITKPIHEVIKTANGRQFERGWKADFSLFFFSFVLSFHGWRIFGVCVVEKTFSTSADWYKDFSSIFRPALFAWGLGPHGLSSSAIE